MKKITLLFIFTGLFNSAMAQNIIWEDNFNDEDVSDWTFTDSDGDGNDWGNIFTVVNTTTNTPVTPVSLISRSWSNVALTPDNWAVSPAIDLSNASGTITVDYVTQVAAQSWDEEKYSIHVGTSNDISILVNSAFSQTQILGDAGDTGAPTAQSLDISGLAGESTVYIAFRHWDCTDQDFLSIDDLVVDASSVLNIDEFEINNFTYAYNNRLNTLLLQSSTQQRMTKLTIYSILGQKVISKPLNTSDESINLSDLNDGIYVAKVYFNESFKTIKFVKS